MQYNFDLAVSATISVKVAEEMVKKIVEEQTEKKVASIEPKFKTITTGNEVSKVFDGFVVYFVDEKKSLATAITDSKPFKVQTYS